MGRYFAAKADYVCCARWCMPTRVLIPRKATCRELTSRVGDLRLDDAARKDRRCMGCGRGSCRSPFCPLYCTYSSPKCVRHLDNVYSESLSLSREKNISFLFVHTALDVGNKGFPIAAFIRRATYDDISLYRRLYTLVSDTTRCRIFQLLHAPRATITTHE